MSFAKAYGDVQVTARGNVRTSEEKGKNAARNDGPHLVAGRVKTFVSIDYLKFTILLSLNDDPVYSSILSRVPDWLAQKGATAVVEAGADEDDLYSTAHFLFACEEDSGECNVQIPSCEQGEELDAPFHPPNNISTGKPKTLMTSKPSKVSRAHTESRLAQPQPAELQRKILPVSKYSYPFARGFELRNQKRVKRQGTYPIRLNPSKKRGSADGDREDRNAKRIYPDLAGELSPLYLGVTSETALGPWDTLPTPNGPFADKADSLEPDLLPDDHPFSIRNQFRMSTEFAPLWRSYDQVDSDEGV
ncbi:hypothetical protein FKW77_008551 [Venturia effusa]|uniref:Uncharacterized protein n=1 Tax=Venturia effusa TaxID=50376 RepID=A0A517LEI1_9PEZI|nr:hypothetical protein FKW77_008551 [Venturia effusa]